MRIVCISDTHLAHLPPQRIDVPDGDVLIHAGDATFKGTEDEILLFAEWFHYLPHKRKIFVPGNHDCGFEEYPLLAPKLLPDYVDCLVAAGVTIDGVKFWGSPWQPEFCNWAFNRPRGPVLRAHWALIPDDTDVLVTHSPPLGVLDRVWQVKYPSVKDKDGFYTRRPQRYQEHVGCADMWQAVQRVQPKLHVFGHIHSDAGVQTKEWPSGKLTTFINAAICNEDYQPKHKAVVIDL